MVTYTYVPDAGETVTKGYPGLATRSLLVQSPGTVVLVWPYNTEALT